MSTSIVFRCSRTVSLQAYQPQETARKKNTVSDSFCDVQISEHATPTPAVFRAACWSSAENCHEQVEGKHKTKTMSVIIHADNTWTNEETGEQGYDEKAEKEAMEKDLAELNAKAEGMVPLTGEDFDKVPQTPPLRVFQLYPYRS
ncbi:hypothetical protein EJ08DRAFT_654755 [Tothia fuscella]|uniref:Uncharacterized protein n=1 Tax=Tothia fuscella TaxID=1048955 RepID=A0A9P4NE62_9PEZI|nr:hypothetical protein EJ08DRAFT_654755 [Tothia fuscella]